MQKIFRLVFIIFVMLFISTCVQISKQPNTAPDISGNSGDLDFTPAPSFGEIEFEPDSFLVEGPLDTFIIYSLGKIIHKSNSTSTPYIFNIPFESFYYTEQLLYMRYLNDIYFLVQISNYESGRSLLIDYDLQMNKIEWMTRIPGFNIGSPLVAGEFVYLTAIGFVGKLNLSSGEFVWSHERLYRPPGYYNAFRKPILMNGKVRFPELKIPWDNRKELILVIDDKTGEIVSGKPPEVKPKVPDADRLSHLGFSDVVGYWGSTYGSIEFEEDSSFQLRDWIREGLVTKGQWQLDSVNHAIVLMFHYPEEEWNKKLKDSPVYLYDGMRTVGTQPPIVESFLLKSSPGKSDSSTYFNFFGWNFFKDF